MKYGDPVSLIVTINDSTEKRDLIYDRVESINLGMETADLVLFHESKDTIGDMNKAIPFKLDDISGIQSIRGIAYTPVTEVLIKPEKSKSVSVSTIHGNTSGSTVGVQRELKVWDNMGRKKISLRMVLMAKMLQRKNLKSDQYAKLCADIENMIIYMGYNDKIDRLLDRLLVKKKQMERRTIQVDNLMIFSDGSIYIIMSYEVSLKKKISRSIPVSDTAELGIYEKDGRFYCPCGNSYKTKYHATFNHRQHMERKAKQA